MSPNLTLIMSCTLILFWWICLGIFHFYLSFPSELVKYGGSILRYRLSEELKALTVNRFPSLVPKLQIFFPEVLWRARRGWSIEPRGGVGVSWQGSCWSARLLWEGHAAMVLHTVWGSKHCVGSYFNLSVIGVFLSLQQTQNSKHMVIVEACWRSMV